MAEEEPEVELTHELTMAKLGFLKGGSLVEWKREGYAEYAASKLHKNNDLDYSIGDRLGNFYSGKYDDLSKSRKYYIRSGLLVEYLINIKGFDFERVMGAEILEKDILSEIRTWHSQNHITKT